MSEPTRYLARQDGMRKHKDGTWIRFEEYAELQAEVERLSAECNRLVGALDAETFKLTGKMAECDALKSWQVSVLKEIGPEPILVYREFDWYYWASHRITNLAAKLVEASNAMVSLRSKLSDHVSLADVDAFDAAIAKLQPAPLGDSHADV